MTDTGPRFVRFHPQDNLAVAAAPVSAGSVVSVGDVRITVQAAVPAGHKIAIRPVAEGEPLLKSTVTIGFAATALQPGDYVHTHNVAFRDFARSYEFATDLRPAPPLPDDARPATFRGFRRADGRVGTRNFIGIVAALDAPAGVATMIARHFRGRRGEGDDSVDGVVAFEHRSGAGQRLGATGRAVLERTLAGYLDHPNLGAVLVILPAEPDASRADGHTLSIASGADRPVAHLRVSAGGRRRAVADGVAWIDQVWAAVAQARRQPAPASALILGLQCGGSDAYSSISANPALGRASDRLIQHGGTAILSETPEVFGVEHLLTRRSVSEAVGRRLLDRIDWWRRYSHGQDGQFNNNTSPGNKAGGLASIFEKSLGSVMKAGSTPLRAVYDYAERIDGPGLVFMDSPGFDPCSSTGQIAAGANLICFTTGRGSCFGSKPAPCIKIATNTPMFERLRDDMDIDCGPVLDGRATLDGAGEAIFQQILAVASGEPTRSERNGLGDFEFVPWHQGEVI